VDERYRCIADVKEGWVLAARMWIIGDENTVLMPCHSTQPGFENIFSDNYLKSKGIFKKYAKGYRYKTTVS
jgi:hypothetical protein